MKHKIMLENLQGQTCKNYSQKSIERTSLPSFPKNGCGTHCFLQGSVWIGKEKENSGPAWYQ